MTTHEIYANVLAAMQCTEEIGYNEITVEEYIALMRCIAREATNRADRIEKEAP